MLDYLAVVQPPPCCRRSWSCAVRATASPSPDAGWGSPAMRFAALAVTSSKHDVATIGLDVCRVIAGSAPRYQKQQ
jgi:hypothetical protein